jgi:magnesium transporter
MDVFWIANGVVKSFEAADIGSLLARDDGFVWVDIAECTEGATETLQEVFDFHPIALKACLERSHVPSVHAYPDYLSIILHAPEGGDLGHVHLVELDQFIGRNFLVTTHGPLGAGVAIEAALRETRATLDRIETGRFSPSTPAELSYGIVSAIARKQEAYISRLATAVATLERRIVLDAGGDPEVLLEEMFKVRHELLTVRTMSAQSREVYARISSLSRYMPEESLPYVADLMDQFDRVRSICDGEKDFLQGVVDFYQSRVTTKINVAMERLALISAIMLPITAIAGILGMNVIVLKETSPVHLIWVMAVMGLIALGMFRWAKRQGWW